MAPKVSVIMSVYNGETYLREAIDSILDQTFEDFEFLIINDGSMDRTGEILKGYCDCRIRIINNKRNVGLSRSLNTGMKTAKGDYIARMDADDVSLRERLWRQVNFLDNHPEIILVSSEIEFIDANGQALGKSQRATDPHLIAWYLLFYNYIGGHSQVMFRHFSHGALWSYAANCPYGQDYELWSRLIEAGDMFILPDVLVKYRMHGKNLSVKAISEQKKWTLDIARSNIARMVGERPSPLRTEQLVNFWLGHYPVMLTVGTLHRELRRVYESFLRWQERRGTSYPGLSHKLRTVIGMTFLRWISFNLRDTLVLKFQASLYAFVWYPSGVLRYCFRGASNFLLHCFHHTGSGSLWQDR